MSQIFNYVKSHVSVSVCMWFFYELKYSDNEYESENPKPNSSAVAAIAMFIDLCSLFLSQSRRQSCLFMLIGLCFFFVIAFDAFRVWFAFVEKKNKSEDKIKEFEDADTERFDKETFLCIQSFFFAHWWWWLWTHILMIVVCQS